MTDDLEAERKRRFAINSLKGILKDAPMNIPEQEERTREEIMRALGEPIDPPNHKLSPPRYQAVLKPANWDAEPDE